MKQLNLILLIAIGTSYFISCKKKDMPKDSIENEPQFSFNGTVNGNQIDIKAGIDNYYMYSSFAQSQDNLYSFIGQLQQTNCNICPNSISIEIKDHRISATNGNSGADSALSFQYYPILSGNPLPAKHSATFYSLFNNYASSYNWNFGDGTSSNLAQPTHIYNGAGEFNVCLTIQDTNGCTNSLCNIQKIGNLGEDCKTSINSSSTSTLSATFTHSTVGLPPYSFYWNFGDGTTSTTPFPSHNFVNQGRYPISLRVIDARNDTAYANLNFITPNSNQCATNYLLLGVYDFPNPSGFSNVVIKWTDASGKEYTSNDFAQPTSSYFKILKVEDYHTNDFGQKTKKLTLQFSCKVFNGSSSISIHNAKAIIAVAYK